jgi:hypothetical protein
MQGGSYRRNPSALAQLVGSIEKEYRELLDLREQVKTAEAAAAQRLKPRGKLTECTRPVAIVVSRRPVTRQPQNFTRHQLYAMLAEAVRNTV